MDILTNNTTTTRTFCIQLQESMDKYRSLRQQIRDKIAETATAQARLMLSEKQDIGNPAQLCEELSKLRLEYTEITVQEKVEKEQIMNTYMQQIMGNMGSPPLNSDDAIKLRVYDKYIQTQLSVWDLPAGVVVWPQNSWQKVHYNQSTSGVQWLNNFRHTINTKFQEERTKAAQNKGLSHYYYNEHVITEEELLHMEKYEIEMSRRHGVGYIPSIPIKEIRKKKVVRRKKKNYK